MSPSVPTGSAGPLARLPQPGRATALAAGLALAAALTGCSAFGGSSGAGTYSGGAVPAGSARSGSQPGSGQASGATSAPGASGSAGATGGSSSTSKPYVAAVAKGTCSPQKFAQSAGLVGGAITTYITKPLAAPSVSKATTAQAASAAGYAAKQLGTGVTAVESCPTAKALTSVSKQSLTALQRLSSALRAGTVDQQKVAAVGALFGDVTAQASRLKLTIKPTAPTVSQLTAR